MIIIFGSSWGSERGERMGTARPIQIFETEVIRCRSGPWRWLSASTPPTHLPSFACYGLSALLLLGDFCLLPQWLLLLLWKLPVISDLSFFPLSIAAPQVLPLFLLFDLSISSQSSSDRSCWDHLDDWVHLLFRDLIWRVRRRLLYRWFWRILRWLSKLVNIVLMCNLFLELSRQSS